VNFAAGTDLLTLGKRRSPQRHGFRNRQRQHSHHRFRHGNRGQLTSGGSELFLHSGSAAGLTINSEITGTLSLVMDSMSTTAGAVLTLNNTNSYIGTAFANGVIVNLGAARAPPTSFPSPRPMPLPGTSSLPGGTTGAVSGAVAKLPRRPQR